MKATVSILNKTEKGSGFGVCDDTGDAVFIPISVMRAADCRELGEYVMKLVPNQFRADVPWMAVFAYRDEAYEEEVD